MQLRTHITNPSETAGSFAEQLTLARAVPGSSCVTYLINQYPKVSHSFIRREILALERSGIRVERIAVRGWDADVVDPDDASEKQRTRYLLKDGTARLLLPALRVFWRRPRQFLQTLRKAWRMSRGHERGLPYHLVYLLEACRALEWIEEAGATHLHAHFGTNPAQVALYIRLLGGPSYSFTIHGLTEFEGGSSIALDTKLKHAKFAAAVSSFTRSQIYRVTDPLHWQKIRVVHCGLDPLFLEGRSEPLPNSGNIVCVGRLSEEKGQIILLEALAKLHANGHRQCRLVLVGDGPMRGLIETRIEQLGLREAVEITGWLSSAEVRRAVLEARVLVCPSFMEGLPVVLMEAMALRRPVVATAIAGIPELVVPGESGWLVPPGDPDALAAAMAECLSMPETEMGALLARAYLRVAERHDVEQEAQKLSRLFFASDITGSLCGWRP